VPGGQITRYFGYHSCACRRRRAAAAPWEQLSAAHAELKVHLAAAEALAAELEELITRAAALRAADA
jgi:hypothetical protein